MHRVFKLVSRITILIFIGMLLYVYAFLPDIVNLSFNQSGLQDLKMGKESFFYTCLGVFVVCTIILSFLKKSLGSIRVTNSESSITQNKKESLQTWADSLSVVLNLFFTFTVTFIGMYHNAEHFNISNFAFLIYLGPILLIGWIFYLSYILLVKA